VGAVARVGPGGEARGRGRSEAPLLRCGTVIESRVRVRYKDTDQMAIAHHSNYVVWFEIGRTDLCREAGMTYREIEERGFILVVVEIGCRYRAPFHYDDEVLIRTTVAEAQSRSIRFAYELLDAAGEKLHATGFSQHVWVDRATRRPVMADPAVTAALVARGGRTSL
jgi:acyl-CoA thioester hydrolase